MTTALPYIPPRQRKPLQVLFSEDERQLISDAARAEGLSQGAWIRRTCVLEAQKR